MKEMDCDWKNRKAREKLIGIFPNSFLLLLFDDRGDDEMNLLLVFPIKNSNG